LGEKRETNATWQKSTVQGAAAQTARHENVIYGIWQESLPEGRHPPLDVKNPWNFYGLEHDRARARLPDRGIPIFRNDKRDQNPRA
jgi:hypothetical protein